MGRPLGRQSITVLTPQKSADPYSGDLVDDWSQAPTEVLVRGCYVEPGTTQEYLLNRDQVLVAWTVYAPPGIPVTAYSRVRYNGVTYIVYGQPAQMDSPSGRIDYTEIILQNWEG